MKFLALVAVVMAQDEEGGDAAPEAVEQDGDCSGEGAVCAEGLCCGVAAAAAEPAEEEQGGDEETNTLTVCNGETATEWTNPEDDSVLGFACNTEGAAALAVSTLAAAYLLA